MGVFTGLYLQLHFPFPTHLKEVTAIYTDIYNDHITDSENIL